MKKEKQTKTLEEHAWSQQVEHRLTSEEGEILQFGDRSVDSYAEVLRRLNTGEYLPIRFSLGDMRVRDIRDTRYLQAYVQALNRNGLNVGRGDAEYGFKMPTPENEDNRRELVIFRRWRK